MSARILLDAEDKIPDDLRDRPGRRPGPPVQASKTERSGAKSCSVSVSVRARPAIKVCS